VWRPVALIDLGAPRPLGQKPSALCGASHNRKNFLFSGSDAGGERAAAIYSLIGTAKLNGLDPQAYLRHVI
jgi:transposase